jgi:protein-ribulosamine 3-kinase
VIPVASLDDKLGEALGEPFETAQTRHSSGGCINSARILTGTCGRRIFLKTNRADRITHFEAEAEGLRELAASCTLRVPKPILATIDNGSALLALEYIPLSSAGNDAQTGTLLARMHQTTQARHGWNRDNWIGASPQKNTPTSSWIEFYREHRLRPQMHWARDNGLRLPKAERLLQCLPAFFPAGEPAASLLHGDLWAGNAAFTDDSQPVVYDPAVYYGDRETDLAMTRLFGGFSRNFYQAYAREAPLADGYEERIELYNLYHILNHYNLFGGGYGLQAEATIERLLHSRS